MDILAQIMSEKHSNPIEFLNQLRQTTEPIGGGMEYSDNGEYVEYDVAVEAVKKEQKQFIDKACEWWNNELTYPTMTQAEIDWYQTKIAEFKKVMKGE